MGALGGPRPRAGVEDDMSCGAIIHTCKGHREWLRNIFDLRLHQGLPPCKCRPRGHRRLSDRAWSKYVNHGIALTERERLAVERWDRRPFA